MRIGIDWGGSKLEIIVLDDEGVELVRNRVETPGDYDKAIAAAGDLVKQVDQAFSETASIGIGIPGSLSPASGLVRNANSVWLNGKPLKQ
ncbi:MAG: ROK family protein, partial [Pseudomonadota bacterium]